MLKNFALIDKNISHSNIVSDSFEDHIGQTVYKSYARENGVTTLAIGYLSSSKNLAGSVFEDLSKEKASDSTTTTNIIYGSTRGLSRFGKVPKEEKEKVKHAYDIYHEYASGVIRSYVDFLSDVAFDGFRNQEDESKKNSAVAKRWFDKWVKNIRLKTILMNAISELWKTNNAIIWNVKSPYIDKYFEDLIELTKASARGGSLEKGMAHFVGEEGCVVDKELFGDDSPRYIYSKSQKRCLNTEQAKEYAAKKKRWSKTQVPSYLFNICPKDCDIKGGRLPGMRLYEIAIDADTMNFVNANADYIGNNYPPEFSQFYNKNGKVGNIVANESNIYHISIRRPDYMFWGEPSWLAAIPNLLTRENKMKSDDQAANKLIKQILLVNVGDKDYPASPLQLKAAAALFNNPAAAFTVVWNHTMKIEFFGPKGLAELVGNQTYEPINKVISEDLGFPLALFGVGDANFATISKMILPVKHKIKTGRMAILEQFLRPLYDSIHEAMGWEEGTITPVFNPNILEDEGQLVKRLMMYVDRHIVPIRDVVESLPEEYEFQKLIPAFKAEKTDIEKGLYGVSKPQNQKGRPPNDPSPTNKTVDNKSPVGEGDTKNNTREISENEEFINQVYKDLNQIAQRETKEQ